MPLNFLKYHQPGELGKVGQLCIIESLGVLDKKTGRRLRDELEPHLLMKDIKLRVNFHSVSNREEFVSALAALKGRVLATGLYPILDIECHGDIELGLQLSDESLVSWEECKASLVEINIASRFNLMLVLGCCYGAYFARTGRLSEAAAFNAYIGPTGDIYAEHLETGLRAFYAELFNSRDFNNAIRAMREASPGFGYAFFTAYGLFREVIAEFVLEQSRGEGLRRRVRSMRRRFRRERSELRSTQAIRDEIKQSEPAAIGAMRRAYFAIEKFPENDARFPLTYADVQIDVRRLAGETF
jgi:hypothetical protein